MSLVEIFQGLNYEISGKRENKNYYALKKQINDLEVWYVRFKGQDTERLELIGRYNLSFTEHNGEITYEPKDDPLGAIISSLIDS